MLVAGFRAFDTLKDPIPCNLHPIPGLALSL